MQKKNFNKIVRLIFIIFITNIVSGCGFFWWSSYPKYEEKAVSYWEKKSTPYLIIQFKERMEYQGIDDIGGLGLSGKGFKYGADYRVILSILNKRLDEKGVFECFASILDDPIKYNLNRSIFSGDIVDTFFLYYDKGIDITPYLVKAYRKAGIEYANYGYSGLRVDMVRALKKKGIKVSELIPLLEGTIHEEESKGYSRPVVSEIEEYLDFVKTPKK